MMLPWVEPHRVPTPDGATIPCAVIGEGPVPMVLLPGAGDGLRTVADAALQLGWFYRGRRHLYRMLAISRREPLPADYGPADHARDAIHAVTALDWGPAVWECNSAGGPIGQQVAVMRSGLVRGLILSSTLHRSNPLTSSVVRHWLELIERECWSELVWSTIELTYSPWRVGLYWLARPLLCRLIAPATHASRLERILRPLLELDQRPLLRRMAMPTLVTGGARDRIVPAYIQREMAEMIPRSRLVIDERYGHGQDIENPRYRRTVDRFVADLWRERTTAHSATA